MRVRWVIWLMRFVLNGSYTFSIAPMMACTDRHDRFFLRLISPHVLLYTEMMTTGMLLHGDFKRFLAFNSAEHPIALQIGGSDPDALKQTAKLGEEFGYDEINLNVGCPSDRVKKGRFGACLMLEPQLVADCVAAMQSQIKIPVSVKCRIGVDDHDSFDKLIDFINMTHEAGCKKFIIHARKAWLNGLSPKQNRMVPPLRYDIVKQVKKVFPNLMIVLNGGIKTLADIDAQLPSVDGIMIGREAYDNPYFLAEIEKKYYPDTSVSTRFDIIEKLIPYVEEQLKNNIKLSKITRHITGLFHGEKGARYWRQYLSIHACKENAGLDVLRQALTVLHQHAFSWHDKLL